MVVHAAHLDALPHDVYGKQVAKDLAGGFTEHYYADAVPVR